MARAERDIVKLPVDGFGIEDLFFSRTDERGVIQSFNTVFARLAGYDPDELFGAPHKLVRHPDMPRAVFHLMWETLKSGRAFGGYVKNRAKDGRYYWVYALALPVEGGFMSVRLKPSSGLLDHVSSLYQQVRLAERERKQPPEAGVEAMHAHLLTEGFANYDDFATHALCVEATSRAEAMGRKPPESLRFFTDMRAALQRMDGRMQDISKQLRLISGAPRNLAIQGGRRQSGQETLKVIAGNYGELSEMVEDAIARLHGSMADLHMAAQLGRIGDCAHILLKEAVQIFRSEAQSGGMPLASEEDARLEDATAHFSAARRDNFQLVTRRIRAFGPIVTDLKRVESGLAMTRVLCRMESARMDEDVEAIDQISDRLGAFQTYLSEALRALLGECRDLELVLSRVDVKSAAA